MQHPFQLCIFLLLAVFSCKTDPKQEIRTGPIVFTQEGTLSITKAGVETPPLAQFAIEMAESEYEIQTGLMYREGMEAQQAMLFVFPEEGMRSFYMKNTRFPLDIIYIDADKRIVSFQKNAKPFDETGLPSGVPAKYVLEINAGLSDKLGLAIGDRITFTREP